MIGHVDADCFYCSAERVRFPHLLGIPIGVLGNHGACVIAKSYEMKAHGVKTGMPIWDAMPLCPQGVYIKRDFEWYEVLSRRMLGIVKCLSPLVEYYSIDEFFFRAETITAAEVQKVLESEVRVPVSVGIAPTKTLAKLISDSAKPNGFGKIATEEEIRLLLKDKPITEVTGIAGRSAAKLARHHITTCDQFANADRAFIRWLLTKKGEELWWELRGVPVQPIATSRAIHKFVSRGGSIGQASADPARVKGFVARNSERLAVALEHYQVVCDSLSLVLSFTRGPEQSRRVKFMGSTAAYDQILNASLWLLERIWTDGRAVHYMQLIAGDLRAANNRQMSLFDQPNCRDQRILEVQQKINSEIGRFTLQSALTLPLMDVQQDPANNYDICDIYGKTCF